MVTLRELSNAAGALAVKVAAEHHEGQRDAYAKVMLEKAVEDLLKAKAHLKRAHRQLNGEDPISGVA